ncbi:hypothetical protein GCM10027404_22570 [Arthrobacter tumbae]|nr:hypothetical protein [Arthrobacter tumbae]
MRTVPIVLIAGALEMQLGRPSLTTTEDQVKGTLARYNGTGSEAAIYGDQLLGVFRCFEKFNSLLRFS